MSLTFDDAVTVRRNGKRKLWWSVCGVDIKQVDLFPSEVDQQLWTVGTKGEICGCQGSETLPVVLLLLRQVTCKIRYTVVAGEWLKNQSLPIHRRPQTQISYRPRLDRLVRFTFCLLIFDRFNVRSAWNVIFRWFMHLHKKNSQNLIIFQSVRMIKTSNRVLKVKNPPHFGELNQREWHWIGSWKSW